MSEFEDFEKPVLTEEEAEWLEDLKKTKGNDLSLCDKADLLYYITRQGFSYERFGFYKKSSNKWVTLKNWDKTTKMRLAYALFRDYIVKQEKRYTAKVIRTGEYLYHDVKYRNLYHTSLSDEMARETDGCLFTKDELIWAYAWENKAYDVERVEKDED